MSASTQHPRFGPEHVDQWRTQGFTILEHFLSAEEWQPVLAELETLYADVEPDPSERKPLHWHTQQLARDNQHRQFSNIRVFPYGQLPALNRISLHPQLIALARALLGVAEVRMYQSHTWAKYTGDADYDQEFHCDYHNHTLAVPAREVSARTANFVLYFTDVTDDLGSLRYVPKPVAAEVLGAPGVLSPTARQQEALRERERSVTVPAGSLLAHGIDTMHRGSNLTQPGGRRLTLTVGFKAAGNDQVGFHVWQDFAQGKWDHLIAQASPEQLACLGIPLPGNSFWTPETVETMKARWPMWPSEAYDVERF